MCTFVIAPVDDKFHDDINWIVRLSVWYVVMAYPTSFLLRSMGGLVLGPDKICLFDVCPVDGLVFGFNGWSRVEVDDNGDW
ncbi:Uncharacterized protein TCM_008899 [Theobroma cacao]|uniref:Uncharacterized protein n=1 Tax=Theobroma cacao TaxID=3641 RepID=A0A061E4E8_THECC|nr:Uncharacterized protein TCM_008899 [Theobroma cacao]